MCVHCNRVSRKSFFATELSLCISRFGLPVVSCLLVVMIISSSIDILYAQTQASDIEIQQEKIILRAGLVTRILSTAGGNLRSSSLQINGEELLQSAAAELAVTIHLASPNRAPTGIRPGESGQEPLDAKVMDFPMNLLKDKDAKYLDTKGVEWIKPVTVSSKTWNRYFERMRTQIYSPSAGVTRFEIAVSSVQGALQGLECRITYEVYDEYPVVRKWVSFTNHGDKWLKIDQLCLEGVALNPEFRHQTILAPGCLTLREDHFDEVLELDNESLDWIIFPGVISFGRKDGSTGVIVSSEIPSAMREIQKDGSMRYRTELFEWVLGPSESFTSEPVFYYGYSGKTWKTASAVSTPRDRAVERSYKNFLSKHVGIVADEVKLHPPLWSTWDALWRNVNDQKMRELANIAARCGFKQFDLSVGWQWDNLGTGIDTERFPDFLESCRYAQSLGLEVSLWVSNYRSAGSRDLELHPDLQAVPLRIKPRKLGPGYGMSFTSPWKYYYARDLVDLHHRYGIIGYMEDHINIRAGDIGFGHESRTRRESLLRGFRSMFEAQDMIHRIAPDVVTFLSHELYWDNPSPGCDIAVLKHGVSYHIPPNAHYGNEDLFRRASGKEPQSVYYGGAESARAGVEARRKAFRKGCEIVRRHLYAHRALPLRCIWSWALMSINHNGSMTPLIQDRQVCSVLMGAPFLFSGDLTTLSEENITHYAERFALVNRLNEEYDIYNYFQFSGVPVPTDTDWHWWGKLNREGYGAVVILRGSGGDEQRIINIPWVIKDRRYRVKACFVGKVLGTFTGQELQEGAIKLSLPVYGQEILELDDQI